MSKASIQSPHDRFFRASMQHPEVAGEFLSTHLPADIVTKIDLKSIDICPGTFIDEELLLTESDVLIKCQIDNADGYVYILAEHQSSQDRLMPFRLMKYMIKIWDYHLTHTKKKEQLPFPVIFPLVFYTGRYSYKAARAVWMLCGEQAELMRNILSSPFHLIDVNTLSEESLTSRKWSGTMEFLLRHRFRQHLEQELGKIIQTINCLMLENKSHFVLQLLSYILVVDEKHRSLIDLISFIHDQASPDLENNIMSLAEILKEEGKLEGKLEGEITIAKRMLDAGSDPVFVEKVTGLSLEFIKTLQNKPMV